MPWPAFVWYAERTTDSLSKILAWSGKCSPICTPGTLVLIGLNSPLTSAGAEGLRSYMSMWLGPPASHTRMIDLRFVLLPSARALSKPGSVSPPSVSAPTRSIDRRFRVTSRADVLHDKVGARAAPPRG